VVLHRSWRSRRTLVVGAEEQARVPGRAGGRRSGRGYRTVAPAGAVANPTTSVGVPLVGTRCAASRYRYYDPDTHLLYYYHNATTPPPPDLTLVAVTLQAKSLNPTPSDPKPYTPP
jgi:hypothetical protein